MCFSWLKKKFRREKTREEKEKLKKEIEAKIIADYKEQATKIGKIVKTSHGGLNMPKYQPCPKCHDGSERERKIEDGAFYICSTHGEFFVRRPQRKPHIPVYQHSK